MRVLVGNYVIDRELGRGGMGIVYAATHRVLGKRAAIKLLANADHDVERFFNEGRAAMAIDHPNVVRVFDLGRASDGRAYIAMELLDGESLAARLARGLLPVRVAVGFARQIAEALVAVHAIDIIHRDLKPENVIVCGERIKLVDFGVAKLAGPLAGAVRTVSGALIGTPTYMSPEQCEGLRELDARSDLYSLGCVLYAMLVGRPPFLSSGTGALIGMHMHEPPPPLRAGCPMASPGLAAVIARLLAKAPTDRFATAREVADVLAQPAMLELASTAGVDATADALPIMNAATAATAEASTMPTAEASTLLAAQRMAGTTTATIEGDVSTLRAAPGQRVAAVPKAPRRLPWIAAIAAIAVTGIVIGVAATTGGESRAPASLPPAADAAVVAHAPAIDAFVPPPVDAAEPEAMVTITLRNAPANTEVHIGGKPYGVAPRITIPRGSGEVMLVLTRDGYRTRSIPIVPDRDAEIDAGLKPRGGSARPFRDQPTNDIPDHP